MKLFLALKKVQNHSSGSHTHIKKIFSSSKIYDSPAPAGEYPPLSTIWKALIYKVFIVDSLVPVMGNHTSSAQVYELPQVIQ